MEKNRKREYGTGGIVRRRGDIVGLQVRTGWNEEIGDYDKVRVPFRGSEAAAKKELKQLVAAHGRGEIATTRQTLGAMVDEWLALVKRDRKPTTFESYEVWARTRVLPSLGAYLLKDLTTGALDAYYLRLTDLGPASVRKVHAVIRGSLALAVRRKLIPANPAEGVTLPPLRREELDIPTAGEVRALIVMAPEPMRTFLRLGAASGARRSELVALRRSRFVNGSLLIREPLKTRASRRDVPLDADTITVLEQLIAEQDKLAETHDFEMVPDPYLFSHDPLGGEPWRGPYVTLAFRRLVTRAGITTASGKGLHFHSLRHFHATQLLSAGVNVVTVAKRLGHANPTVTLNVYGHSLSGDDEAAGGVMGFVL